MARPLTKILRDLGRHRTALDLDRDGLGETLLDAAVDDVFRAIARQESPDGTPWPDLSDAYLRRKIAIALTTEMGYLYGPMLAHSEVVGERSIAASEARMQYGTRDATREEATWFIEGDPARNRPPRPFYALSKDGESRADKIITKHLKKRV